MGHVDVQKLEVVLPDGRPLFRDVSFRVGDGAKVALVGANGSGKTTLLRIVAGDTTPTSGVVTSSGGIGVMRQFIGSVRDDSTVRDLLVSVAPPRIRTAAGELETAELAMMERDDEPTQLAYASALTEWADAGGYDAEVLWDVCTTAALGVPYERAQWREVRTLSGGEQKRLVVEALLRGPDEVLLLDEPDNYLDVPGKRWLEEALQGSRKTVLYVSHDRELLARTATRVVTVEGGTSWVHGGGFRRTTTPAPSGTRASTRCCVRGSRSMSDSRHWSRRCSSRRRTRKTWPRAIGRRRRGFIGTRRPGAAEAPPPPQTVKMRLGGGRTGVRALTCVGLELSGLMKPFDLEVFYGERVAVLGSNGSGKSHFLRLLAGGAVAYDGKWKLGARVVPGYFAQTHDHAELYGRTLVDILWTEASRQRGPAISALRRYELDVDADADV